MALSTAHYAYYYFSLFRAEMVVNGRWYPWCSSLAYEIIKSPAQWTSQELIHLHHCKKNTMS